jgi:hypothetical protein
VPFIVSLLAVWLSLNRRKKDCVLAAKVAIGPD